MCGFEHSNLFKVYLGLVDGYFHWYTNKRKYPRLIQLLAEDIFILEKYFRESRSTSIPKEVTEVVSRFNKHNKVGTNYGR